jgi:class 3 adenylate cyclase
MDDINQWLTTLGLGQYAAVFTANDIDLEVLPELTEPDLEKLGMSMGQRKRLLRAIAALSIPQHDTRPAATSSPAQLQPGTPILLEGERRQTTVLFSDLSGYTAMNEMLDPEEVEGLLSRIKTEAVQIVESYGGIVNQFVGDEVLALFGIPTAHEDDPVRAVRAALELHAMVRRISVEAEGCLGQPIRLHTGISTGLVVTNLRDQRDGTYGITGDTVNTAARLKAQADADAILVSPEMQRWIADFFATETLEAVALKGKAQSIIPYQVVHQTRVATRFEAAAQRGLTRYTGRVHDLATLHRCLEQVRAGRGQFVTVVGEAGVGKSRLLFELRHSLDRDAITVVQGRCQPYGTLTPYLPFRDALRWGLQLREEDTPEQLLAKAVTNIRTIDPALEPYIPLYLHLLSIQSEAYPLPAALQGGELRRALADALAAIITLQARRQPMVLMLEDWHWADQASDAALQRLIGLIAPYPVLLVLLYRPEYAAAWGNLSHHTPLILQPCMPVRLLTLSKRCWVPSGFRKAWRP